MKKRLFLLKLLCLLGFGFIANAAAQQLQEWRFTALLDDKPIGYHNFVLREDGTQRVLESQAEFELKFLFISAYEYEHSATERWTDNCLQEMISKTDDNGTRQRVNGSLDNERFVVTSTQNQAALPACVMSFAYWNPAILQQSRLLNPQTGNYAPVEINYIGREKLTLGNQDILTDRYQLATEGQQITLWYTPNEGHWLGLEALTQEGYRLRYELTNAPALKLSQR